MHCAHCFLLSNTILQTLPAKIVSFFGMWLFLFSMVLGDWISAKRPRLWTEMINLASQNGYVCDVCFRLVVAKPHIMKLTDELDF